MTKSIARLCASCNAINFSAYVWPPPLRHVLQTLPEIDIGTTESVRDRRHVCKLCNLITTQLDQAQSLDIVQNAGDQCRLRSARFEEEELQDHHVEAGTMRDTLGFVARCIAVDIIPVTFTGFVGPVMPDRFFKSDAANPTTRETTAQARPWILLRLQGCTNPLPTVDQLCEGPIELLAPPKHTR
jgi:hypothetical protein